MALVIASSLETRRLSACIAIYNVDVPYCHITALFIWTPSIGSVTYLETNGVFTLSSKRPALARVFLIHLLEVCWTFAGSCRHPTTNYTNDHGFHSLEPQYRRFISIKQYPEILVRIAAGWLSYQRICKQRSLNTFCVKKRIFQSPLPRRKLE